MANTIFESFNFLNKGDLQKVLNCLSKEILEEIKDDISLKRAEISFMTSDFSIELFCPGLKDVKDAIGKAGVLSYYHSYSSGYRENPWGKVVIEGEVIFEGYDSCQIPDKASPLKEAEKRFYKAQAL